MTACLATRRGSSRRASSPCLGSAATSSHSTGPSRRSPPSGAPLLLCRTIQLRCAVLARCHTYPAVLAHIKLAPDDQVHNQSDICCARASGLSDSAASLLRKCAPCRGTTAHPLEAPLRVLSQ